MEEEGLKAEQELPVACGGVYTPHWRDRACVFAMLVLFAREDTRGWWRTCSDEENKKECEGEDKGRGRGDATVSVVFM